MPGSLALVCLEATLEHVAHSGAPETLAHATNARMADAFGKSAQCRVDFVELICCTFSI